MHFMCYFFIIWSESISIFWSDTHVPHLAVCYPSPSFDCRGGGLIDPECVYVCEASYVRACVRDWLTYEPLRSHVYIRRPGVMHVIMICSKNHQWPLE